MTQYIKKLPAVFQTVTEKKFFDATFDQVFSKKDSDLLAGFLGRRNPGTYNPITDFYLPEPSKNRTWWQLEATAFARTEDTTRSNIFFYDDLLERIEYYGGNTLNQDRLFESEYYSFGPPIDYDMFINYQEYYWVGQGLPAINISGVLASDIIGQASFTTPITATPAGLTLSTGMTIILTDDPAYTEPHIVENFGGCDGLGLVPKYTDITAGSIFEFLPWDGTIELSDGRVISNLYWDALTWDVQNQPTTGDYITIERGSTDRNSWSRTNNWYHIDVINQTIALTGTSWPQNATRALRPIIQFVANLQLYKSGTQFRSDISYGFVNDIFGNPLLLSTYQGQTVNFINTALNVSIADGDLVVFMNDTTLSGSPPYLVNNFIYQATVALNVVTFVPYTSFATPVVEGDIVFAISDAPFDGAQSGETWYYSAGIWQQAYNDKFALNQPPLFQLYDHNGVSLDDAITYPESTFTGSEIFSYKINTEPGATVDPVLKFPIVYTSLGQASDIVFDNNLITDRYVYSATRLPINGYYYYKTINSPVTYNNWNLYDLCNCTDITPPPPCNCIEVSKQRVIDKFTVGYGTEYQFKLSVTPYGYPSAPDIIVSVNGIEVLNSTEQVNGYTLVVINNRIYVDLVNYLTALLTTAQAQAPVVEVQTYTQDLLDPAEPGYFQIPQQLEANPNQEEIGEISASNLTEQFSSIISNQIGFTGISFGGSNNYRDSRKNRSVGSYILQNLAPTLKSMLVSSSDDLDFVAGVRFSQDEYTKFKNKYLSVALQLINQQFSPVQYYNNTIVITAWVTEILRILNVSKEFSNAFAYSYMVANGTPFATESFTGPGNSLVTLTNYIDLSDPKNVLYIYDTTSPANAELLTVGVDYDIISTNLAIDVQLKLGAGVKTFAFYLYKDPLPTYIPSTPSKVGTYPVYLPRIELDTSYAIPTNVIIGHDGSKTIAYGDYRDQLLLELEVRIYNFIQSKFRHEYYVPLRVESVRSGYFRQTRYSRQEYLDITESFLNKWSAKNRANYRLNDWASASLSTPVNQLWKLYNYTSAVTPTGAAIDLPGNWKGIFQYYYDTYYPDTRPWEMLGLSEQPSWWITEYGAPVLNLAGQEVWTSTAAGLNNMWADLEAGLIRQGPSAIYDPVTLLPQPQVMWARPGLSAIIPVDAAGEIIPVPTLFNIAMSGNPYEPFDGFDADWVYGDGGPVEQAWMSTSGYAYSVQEFLYLMRPGPFGELLFDTLGTELSPGQLVVPGIESPVMSNTNWQYVQNDFFTSTDPFFEWMRPKNKDQVVHAETIDNVVQVRFGYQNWISDRILFLGKDVGSTFGQKIRTLDVNLANKFAGFTNKDTTTTYIEAVTPGATTSTLLIPSTNFDVFLHESPPVETYSYSGVIVRALADGTFAVYGYDLLNAEFVTLDRSDNKNIEVTVGGTPAEFRYFEVGATYNQGEIVRYNGVYYESLATQLVSKFVPSEWFKLKGLPTVGGVTVTYRPVSDTTVTRYPYGSILKNAQEVFDLMIGWGAYLETQGWQFTEVNQDTNILNDWLTSAKQFLFWLNTSWAPDASIQLSPLANKATLIVKRGYPNDVETLTNGVYSILDKAGVAIPPNLTTTDRDGRMISVEPSDLSVGGIYFLQVNSSETEHVLIFDNTTNFNDVLYSPLLRSRQQRIRFNGFRSNGWYGKMEAPGYLVIDNQLVPNYDTIVEAMRYYYDPNVTIDNPSLEDLGRHLIGYESKSYLDNLQVSNDVQYLFYQGAIRQKGTEQAFDKLFRSTKVQSNEIIKVYEEWALKLSDFGNTIEQVSTEFKLIPEQNTGEVLVARLNFVPSKLGSIRQIRILNAQNTYINIPSVFIPVPDGEPDLPWVDFSEFDSYATGAVVMRPDSNNNPIYYQNDTGAVIPAGTFNPLQWTVILATRNAKAYVILGTDKRISRIDITDPGYGYTTAPNIDILSGAEPNNLDRLYAVWQGAFNSDATLDNIVNIDIDQIDRWTVRPLDPLFSLEFPVTPNDVYPIPNAGYVNFNDVDFSSFDVDQAATTWGTGKFNPLENNTIWIAKTPTDDWDVYKLINVSPEPFDVIVTAGDTLMLRTAASYLITPQFSTTGDTTDFANMIVLQVIEAQATATIASGAITDIVLTKTGANYDAVPLVTITGDGVGATAEATIAGGVVTGFVITNPGTGYTTATVSIAPPTSVGGDTNYTLGFQFNSVETTNEPTHNYYDLVDLDGNPISATDIPEYENFTDLMLYKTLRFLTEPAVSTPTYVSVGDKIWVDGINLTPPKWTVYDVVTPNLVYPTGHKPFREQENLINTHLFESASVFNDTGKEIVQLPVYDPFKNILPGPAKQNITFMAMQDPARYNVTGNPALFSENIIFGQRQVGQLWWDLSDTRYVYYEQPIALDGSETDVDSLVYRRDHWAQLFPGSTVRIYEWVQSPVPPAQYTGTGVPKSLTDYVQLMTSNRFTNTTEIKYYFWVIGSTNRPNIENRTMAALDVARLLQSPKSQGFSFFSPIQQTETNNSYMFYNVQEILAYQGDNIQVQYRIGERDDQAHTQWAFFREGDPNSLVTDQFWNKMVDSLCAYTKVLPVSDEFLNGIIVANYLPWDVFGWDIAPWDNALDPLDPDYVAPQYGEILPVPDPTLSEGEKYGILYRPRQGMFVKLEAARKVFVQAANDLLKHIPIRDDNPSWNAGVGNDQYWTYTNWYEIGYENVLPTIVYPTLTAANAALVAGQLQKGTILEVTAGTPDGRYVLYAVVQLNPNVSTLSLEEVCIENSAIKLLDTVYTTVNVYGLSTELRELLNAFRTEVMVDANIVDQNELFFSMLNYVLSEQKNPDWVFKSSYIYIKEDNIPLTQNPIYTPDNIQNVIDYIIDAKPYHTQIRDYTSTYTTSDIAAGTASDSYLWNIQLQFGPDFAGTEYEVPSYIINAQTFANGSNIFGSNPLLVTPVDQFVSQENVYTITVSPGDFDPSKIGYSQLFPYTINFNSLNQNNPQTFVTPYNIVGVQIGPDVLIYGQDYYVEDNGDTTYTIYFFEDPGTTPSPVALVWIDAGDIMTLATNVPNAETADGYPTDDLVINVDTLLPVNDVGGIYEPYVGWGDVWEAVADPVAQILIDAGGTPEISWDAPRTLVLLPNSVSSKENTNVADGANFYRNADLFAGVLLIDLPAPEVPVENTPVITVYVDPLTHPVTDILPEPGALPGVIWIDGERIEYKDKRIIAPNTWELRLVRRGTMGTAPTSHDAMIPSLANPLVLVPNPVWVEKSNIMPVGSNTAMWSALDSTGDPLSVADWVLTDTYQTDDWVSYLGLVYAALADIPANGAAPNINPDWQVVPAVTGPIFRDVSSVPLGGIWYSQTQQAIFLQASEGKSIP